MPFVVVMWLWVAVMPSQMCTGSGVVYEAQFRHVPTVLQVRQLAASYCFLMIIDRVTASDDQKYIWSMQLKT